ncbi:MAG: EAL domain-containing protein, partial [Pseudomonadota bacterium]
ATKRAEDSVRFGILASVVIVTLVLAIAILTANSIIRRIVNMVDKLKHIALEDGDLKVRLDVTGADEMTELAFWFNKIIAKLEHTSHEAENNILRIANTDELSGLRNRRYLMSWLQNRILQDNRDAEFSIVFLDLDDFKPINDTYGHEAGDELIKQVARRLRNFTMARFNFTVPSEEKPDEYVTCRLGGDEFMLVLPAVTDRAELSRLVADLVECICAPYILADIECEVGVSIGLSRYPIDATDRGTLLDRADMAMYEAKRKGKRQFAFYERKLEQKHGLSNSVIQCLKKPSTKKEMYLEYQPKFLIRDGSCMGAEALLRWRSPELGLISPEVFIPLAEQNQLITDIDLWVLKQVCSQIRQWHGRGVNPGVIAINLSAITLQKPNLTEAVAEVLQSFGVEPRSIQLEITESTVLDLSSRLTETISDLRTLGVSIAMDDFGAGHSSLKLLINNQIDLVKLDKSLIDEITTSTRQQRIVDSIITLANSLDVRALAEGIERIDQLEYLRSVLCTEGQGFYFSMPLSAQEYLDTYLQPDIRMASGI